MSESARTLAYAGVAVTSVILAGIYSWATQPNRVEGFADVGEAFYPDFEDPSEADSLRVAAFDEETATIKQFAISQTSPGQWVIPTHYDYPADAQDRLNRTANSIIGIKRGAQKASRENQHAELGVLDPLAESSELEGRGQRVTLKKGDTVLADYIIGKKAGEEGNLYHVRVPKTSQVYLAEINVDLSTKFGDWIETDLLKIDKNSLREVIVNKYSIEEQRGVIVGQEVNVLKRDASSGPWTLEGLNEETEEVKTAEVDSMLDALDELKIVGVRPKPKGLNADLTLDPQFVRNQLQLNSLRAELQGKGFFIQPGAEGEESKLYANEGNLMAATEDGLVYTLNFGELFSGSAEEIEIGKENDDGDKEDEPSMEDSNNRYLFVSVALDEKYLGEKPTKPAMPQKPEGLMEAPAETQAGQGDSPDQKKDEKEEDEEDNADEAGDDPDAGGCFTFQDEQQKTEADETKTQESGAAETGETQEPKKAATEDTEPASTDAKQEPAKQEPKPESEEDKQKRLAAQWAAEQQMHKTAMADYESAVKAYEQKVKDSQKKVDDLNYRLGAWYYVISGESFKTLRLARTDLVKPKEKKVDPNVGPGPTLGPGAGGMQPAGAPGGKPNMKPAEEVKKDKPADATPPKADDPAAASDEGKKAEPADAGSDQKASPPPTKESSDAGEAKEGTDPPAKSEPDKPKKEKTDGNEPDKS